MDLTAKTIETMNKLLGPVSDAEWALMKHCACGPEKCPCGPLATREDMDDLLKERFERVIITLGEEGDGHRWPISKHNGTDWVFVERTEKMTYEQALARARELQLGDPESWQYRIWEQE